MTLSERRLWAALRKLDLHIRRQAPIGPYITDFAHHSARVVIEVDGARHDLEEAVVYDHFRDEWLRSQGYRVVRVRNGEAFSNAEAVAARVAALIKGQD